MDQSKFFVGIRIMKGQRYRIHYLLHPRVTIIVSLTVSMIQYDSSRKLIGSNICRFGHL